MSMAIMPATRAPSTTDRAGLEDMAVRASEMAELMTPMTGLTTLITRPMNKRPMTG